MTLCHEDIAYDMIPAWHGFNNIRRIMFMSLGRHTILGSWSRDTVSIYIRRVSTCNASPKDESWILDPEVELPRLSRMSRKPVLMMRTFHARLKSRICSSASVKSASNALLTSSWILRKTPRAKNSKTAAFVLILCCCASQALALRMIVQHPLWIWSNAPRRTILQQRMHLSQNVLDFVNPPASLLPLLDNSVIQLYGFEEMSCDWPRKIRPFCRWISVDRYKFSDTELVWGSCYDR